MDVFRGLIGPGIMKLFFMFDQLVASSSDKDSRRTSSDAKPKGPKPTGILETFPTTVGTITDSHDSHVQTAPSGAFVFLQDARRVEAPNRFRRKRFESVVYQVCCILLDKSTELFCIQQIISLQSNHECERTWKDTEGVR